MQYEAAAVEEGDDSDEEISLVVVVDQCLVQEISAPKFIWPYLQLMSRI
jgi:hypothetical protein